MDAKPMQGWLRSTIVQTVAKIQWQPQGYDTMDSPSLAILLWYLIDSTHAARTCALDFPNLKRGLRMRACWLVHQVDCSLHFVHVLPTGTPRSGSGQVNILGVNFDINIIHFWHDGDCGCGRMYAPLALCGRYSLYSMNTALKL